MANVMGGKRVSKAEYKDIKELLGTVSLAVAGRLCKRSYPTVKRIQESDSFADYRNREQVKTPEADKGVDIITSLAQIETLLNNVLDEYSKISLRVDMLENRARFYQVPVDAQVQR